MFLIKNGLLVNPKTKTCEILDILVEGEKVKKIGKDLEVQGEYEIIDASGKVVAPGFIDMHVHLREPGLEYKETILTGVKAAVNGGFTSITCMPNTDPVIDSEAVVESIIYKAEKYGYADVYPYASITKDLEGKELSEMGLLKRAGAVAFSDDGGAVKNTAVMRRAFDYGKVFDALMVTHCEDIDLAGEGVMHEGEVSTNLGLPGIPSEAEDIIIARDILLAGLTKGRLHICHVSSKKGVEMIREAKKKGLRVTAEATPHHFTLTHEAVRGYDSDTKVNPPLRTEEDRQEIIRGLKDGSLDCIATDHAPHALHEKEDEFLYAPFGISGLETAVPLAWNNLYHKEKLSLLELVEKFSLNPAQILGLDRGSLEEGKFADIVIIDSDLEKEVDRANFYSLGKNTPFDGLKLKGWPVCTMKKGKVVMLDGKVIEE